MKTYTTFRAYKFRAYPSQSSKKNMEEVLELCRALHNRFLFERKLAYEWLGFDITSGKGGYRSYYYKQIKKIRAEDERYRKLSVCISEGVYERLQKAYESFFRRVKAGDKPGYPRFKGKGRYNTIEISKKGFQFKRTGKQTGRLNVKGIGELKFRMHREVEGKPKNAFITKTPSGKYFVSIGCEVEKVKRVATGAAVGIDMGLTTFATISDGTEIENPRFLRKAADNLADKQRIMARKVKGSKRFHKARIKTARAYERLVNKREKFQHKLANELLAKYSEIYVEDLSPSNMVEGSKARGLNKSIGDASWSEFFKIMEYKAEEAGVLFHKVNPKGTTRKCSRCGNVKEKMLLSERVYVCSECGYVKGRDLNAAYNIRDRGMRACGSSMLAVKSENSLNFEGGYV